MVDHEQERITREVVDRLRKALRAAPMAGTKLVESFGECATIQVVCDRDGGGPKVVVSITVRSAAPPAPPAKQPGLPGVVVPFTPRAARPAAEGEHTFAALALSVVAVRDALERLRNVCPRVGWHDAALGRWEAIVGADDVERLRRHYAGREDVLFVRPFEPECAGGIVLEVYGEGETQSDLATSLSAALAPNGAPRLGTRHGAPVAELPRSTSERDLAWAAGYLLSSGVAWSAREQAAPGSRRRPAPRKAVAT